LNAAISSPDAEQMAAEVLAVRIPARLQDGRMQAIICAELIVPRCGALDVIDEQGYARSRGTCFVTRSRRTS
jgi:hypothetical protein